MAQPGAKLRIMEATESAIDFTLRPGSGAPVRVRLRRVASRWLAEVSGPVSTAGLGGSARQALTAALQPLGDGATRLLLADLGLLQPSLAVLEIEAVAGAG